MNGVRFVLVVSLLSTTALGQVFDPNCPKIDGFYADAEQCDKYHHCVAQTRTEKLCPDGMAFNELNPALEKCDFYFQVECGNKTILQPARPTRNCPRQNGYFPHKNASICNEFFYCAGGVGSHITCPESLVFSLKTKTCVWPEEAARVGCSSENVLNFTCPKVDFRTALAHPRYPDLDDCQYFYVCINGKEPRHNGCKFGEVFNSETGACDQPINVPDCSDYYKEFFENYFKNLGSGGTKLPTADILAAAIGSGFKVPNLPKRIRIDSGSATQKRRRPVAEASPSVSPVEVPREREQANAPADFVPPSAPARRRPFDSAPAADTPVKDDTAAGAIAPQGRPPGRRPIGGDGTNRRQPIRRRRPVQKQATTTTTTTTTTTPLPLPDDEYYYYDYVDESTPAAPVK